jgi:hypothetical protein
LKIMRTWSARLTSLVLVLLFLGNVGLPVVDGFVFHDSAEHERRVHVEAADGPGCHTEDCAVHWLPASHSIAAGTLALPETDEVQGPAHTLRPQLAPALRPPHRRQSRAPPRA